MKEAIFWGDWERPYRISYQILLGLFIAAAIYFISSYLGGNDQVFTWETQTDRRYIENTYEEIDLGFYRIPITSLGPVIYQSFEGSGLKVIPEVASAFALLLMLAVGIILTVFTYLKRNWFIGAMILFIASVIGFRLENILLFGSVEKWASIILFVIFIPLGYYFNTIRQDTKFAIRIGAFYGGL